MQFFIVDKMIHMYSNTPGVYLVKDNWDDFGFKTSFYAHYVGSDKTVHELGQVKIASQNHFFRHVSEVLPNTFSELGSECVSLGQSEDYYVNISSLRLTRRIEILVALRDIAYDLELYHQFKMNNTVETSLLRFISDYSIRNQLHRIAQGGAKLTAYDFTYTPPETMKSSPFHFSVQPDSVPPTNIHVLIGRNGAGKTQLIKNMINSIVSNKQQCGTFSYSENTDVRNAKFAEFANVVCIAFSPFDDFSSIDTSKPRIPYSYIGLEKKSPNLSESIQHQFQDNISACLSNPQKAQRLKNALENLSSDPVFYNSNIHALLKTAIDTKSANSYAITSEFSCLSSGHKIILLIIVCCINKVEEKSIVFLDEPENHLHPPLLSAFIRTLSNLMIDRNGVAIISTHSPVIVQEVPKSCVFCLRRISNCLVHERLSLETFGSNMGLINEHVFGLEVKSSGFHQILELTANSANDFQEAYEHFNGQLGDEANAILRLLFALKDKRDN